MLLVLVSVLAVAVYWSVPHRFRMAWLSVVSIGVVLSWDWLSGVLVFLSSVLVYAGARKRSFNTILLIFLVTQLIAMKVLWTTVPLGLSFFSFCLLHYCIETRRDNLPTHNASEFFAYTLLYPIYSAGPIERFDHFKNNLSDRPLWQQGITRIAIGMIKKWLIAEWLLGSVLAVQPVLSDELLWHQLWAMLIGLFLKLYFDFGGYCDMAIGLSMLFGIRIAENFRFPLLAANLSDFWKRWHISLSNWCQTYIYLPALGITRNPYLAILATFLVMGLWHAISWQWLCWGLWHALGLMVHLRWRRWTRNWEMVNTTLYKTTATLLTLLYVSLGCAFSQFHGQANIAESVELFSKALGVGYLLQ